MAKNPLTDRSRRLVETPPPEPAAVNILITRKIRPEAHEAFEGIVRDWIARAVHFPGYLGVFMRRPDEDSNEFGALLRFRSPEDWERFKAWEPYQKFLDEIDPMLECPPRVERLHGLEAWFGSRKTSPPRWKMAIVTWIGVNAMVYPGAVLVHQIDEGWPFWLSYLAINTSVVATLTWIVMPILTSLTRPWLRRRAKQPPS